MVEFSPFSNTITINSVVYYIKPCQWLIDALLQVVTHIHYIPDKQHLELSTICGKSVIGLTLDSNDIKSLCADLIRKLGIQANEVIDGFILDNFSDIEHRKTALLWLIRHKL